MLEQKTTISEFSSMLIRKKDKYFTSLEKLETLLEDIIIAEKKMNEKLIDIECKYSGQASLKGMHNDIEKANQIAKHESELSHIIVIKEDLIRNILIVKTKHENFALRVDNIVFDNIIMIDAILKNFTKLSKV